MTREYLKKLLPIMQAYVNGETLQYRQVGFPNSEWTDSNNDDIDFFQDNWEYRVKPIEIKHENDTEKYIKLMKEGKKILFHQYHNWHEVKDEKMLIKLSKLPYVDFKVAKTCKSENCQKTDCEYYGSDSLKCISFVSPKKED